MAAKYTHDLVATIGEYTAGNGDKKKEYINIGKAFTSEDGRVSLKLDALPTNPNWSGWISLYPRKERDGQPAQPQQPRAENQSYQQQIDDIPF